MPDEKKLDGTIDDVKNDLEKALVTKDNKHAAKLTPELNHLQMIKMTREKHNHLESRAKKIYKFLDDWKDEQKLASSKKGFTWLTLSACLMTGTFGFFNGLSISTTYWSGKTKA